MPSHGSMPKETHTPPRKLTMTQKILRVGIITTSTHPIKTTYLPILQSLPQCYQIVTIHNASQRIGDNDSDSETAIGPATSPTVEDVLQHPAVDIVLNFMPNEYHEKYTITALEAGKHVMVGAPVSLSIPSAKRIIEAEKRAPSGARVFVACARRYSPCIEEVFKREVKSLGRIYYARCRMIAGPRAAQTVSDEEDDEENAPDVLSSFASDDEARERGSRSGRVKKWSMDKESLQQGLLKELLGGHEMLSQERVALSRFLASLGCHDLGLVRDTLGYPDAISNISVNEPFYSALFHYTGESDGRDYPFTLTYETGTDCVPRCDAQLAIYGHTKTVTAHYDLPYARGQPMRVVVEMADEKGVLKQTESVSTWEEAYREELQALYAYLVEGKPVKTTARDALQDLKLFQTIFEQYDRQCGTIKTPLG